MVLCTQLQNWNASDHFTENGASFHASADELDAFPGKSGQPVAHKLFNRYIMPPPQKKKTPCVIEYGNICKLFYRLTKFQYT